MNIHNQASHMRFLVQWLTEVKKYCVHCQPLNLEPLSGSLFIALCPAARPHHLQQSLFLVALGYFAEECCERGVEGTQGQGERAQIGIVGIFCQEVQSSVKTLRLSSENHLQNVLLPTSKLHYDVIFQPAMPETWQECLYTTLQSAPPKFICSTKIMKKASSPPFRNLMGLTL